MSSPGGSSLPPPVPPPEPPPLSSPGGSSLPPRAAAVVVAGVFGRDPRRGQREVGRPVGADLDEVAQLRVAGNDGLGVDSDHAARDRPGGGADRLDEAPELELVSGGVLLADAVGHGISVGIEVKTDLDEVAESRRADEDGRVVDGEGPTADRPGRVGGLLDGALEFLVFARLLRAPRHDPGRSAVRAADADFRGLEGTDRRRGQGDLRHHPDAEVRAGAHEAAGAGKRRVAVELDANAEDFHAPAVFRHGRDLPLEGERILPFQLRSIHPEAAVGFPRPDAKRHRASGSQVRRGQGPPGDELGHASRQAEMLGHAHEGQVVARDRSDGAGPPAGAGRRERGGGREQERKRQPWGPGLFFSSRSSRPPCGRLVLRAAGEVKLGWERAGNGRFQSALTKP